MENTELLRKIFLFKDFTAMEVLQFNKILTSLHVKAGERVIQQGDISDSLYVIKSGAVEVYLEDPMQQVVLTSLRAVDHFGEMALLDDSPRSASVRATEDTVLIMIKREPLEAILNADHGCASKFYKALSKALALRLRNSNNAIAKVRDSLAKVVPSH
jgi:CRP-like cAMP-binding protein